ncbi:MAG TPA: hypothetical protein VH684_07000 [Xanthobacteraceae bacterium]
MVRGLRSKGSRQTAPLRLAYSAPEIDTATVEELRRLTLPATKALPFVKLRVNDQPLWRPESYWHVKSTGNRGMDVELGRSYARKAIAAMKADRNEALIALVVQDMIHGVVGRGSGKRRGPLGRVAAAFLKEISRSLAKNAE